MDTFKIHEAARVLTLSSEVSCVITTFSGRLANGGSGDAHPVESDKVTPYDRRRAYDKALGTLERSGEEGLTLLVASERNKLSNILGFLVYGYELQGEVEGVEEPETVSGLLDRAVEVNLLWCSILGVAEGKDVTTLSGSLDPQGLCVERLAAEYRRVIDLGEDALTRDVGIKQEALRSLWAIIPPNLDQ